MTATAEAVPTTAAIGFPITLKLPPLNEDEKFVGIIMSTMASTATR